MYAYVHTYVYTHVYMYMHVFTHIYTLKYMFIYINMYIYINVYMCIGYVIGALEFQIKAVEDRQMQEGKSGDEIEVIYGYVCVHKYLFICICIYGGTYIHIYVCIYVK
jgi:hypothetical protein